MSSLFQLKKFWHTSFPDEEFSPDAVTCGNLINEVDDEGHEVDLLAIGSFQGRLRVWLPGDTPGVAQPEDVVLDTKYSEPILQIQCGPYEPPHANNTNCGAATEQLDACVGAKKENASGLGPSPSSAPSSPAAGTHARNLLAVLFARRLMLVRLERDAGIDAAHDTQRQNRGCSGADDDDRCGETSSVQPPIGGAGVLGTAAVDDRSGLGAGTDGATVRTKRQRCICTTYYEVDLERPMYNFTSGNFGKRKYAQICAQSMDGHLIVVDHNKVVHRCALPAHEFVLPGVLAYCSLTDSILTVNSSHVLLCYSLLSIAEASADYCEQDRYENSVYHTDNFIASHVAPASAATVLISAQTPLRARWVYDVAEEVIAMAVCTVTRGLSWDDTDIVVLCPYALHIVSMHGSRRIMRMLEVEASCLHCYQLSKGSAVHNVLVGTYHGALYVYEDVATSWCAKLTSPTAATSATSHVTAGDSTDNDRHAVRVLVSRLCGVQGMMVILDSSCALSIDYLGTGGGRLECDVAAARISSPQSYDEMVVDLGAIQRELSSVGAAPSPSGSSHSRCAESVSALFKTDDERAATASRVSAQCVVLSARNISSARWSGADDADATTARMLREGAEHAGATRDATAAASGAWARVVVSVRSARGVMEGVVVQVESTEPITMEPRRVEVARVTEDCAVELVFTCRVACAHDAETGRASQAYPVAADDGAAGEAAPVSRSSPCSRAGCLPISSLDVTVLALYASPASSPTRRTRSEMLLTQLVHTLPLSLVAHTTADSPPSAFTMQLNTNQPTFLSLIDLFADMASAPTAVMHPNTVSFRFCDGTVARVIASTNAVRFRIQAAAMEQTWLLASELVRRVRERYPAHALLLSTPDEIPLCAWLLLTQAHIDARAELSRALEELDTASCVFDAVHSRLLGAYVQPTPSAWPGAAVSRRVFDASWALLQRCLQRVEERCAAHKAACARLGAGARLFGLYLEVEYAEALDAHPRDRALLRCLLRCDVSDGMGSVAGGVSWEETVEETLLRAMDMTSSGLPLPTAQACFSTSVGEKEEELQRERVGTGGSTAQLQMCWKQLILRLSNKEPILR